MELKLGQLTIDAAGNLSLFLAGAETPYVVIPIDKSTPIWTYFKGMEEPFLKLVASNLKIA